eukprot:g3033.t1
MADLPYMCGQSPQQMLQLRREVNKAEMRPHAAHPCAKEFMTVTSAVDGCPMRVLDYSAKYRPGAVSTEYRDIYGYNDAVRWRLAHAEQLKGAIRCAGQPSWQGGVLNHHNRQYERLAHLQKIQKAEGCYTNDHDADHHSGTGPQTLGAKLVVEYGIFSPGGQKVMNSHAAASATLRDFLADVVAMSTKGATGADGFAGAGNRDAASHANGDTTSPPDGSAAGEAAEDAELDIDPEKAKKAYQTMFQLCQLRDANAEMRFSIDGFRKQLQKRNPVRKFQRKHLNDAFEEGQFLQQALHAGEARAKLASLLSRLKEGGTGKAKEVSDLLSSARRILSTRAAAKPAGPAGATAKASAPSSAAQAQLNKANSSSTSAAAQGQVGSSSVTLKRRQAAAPILPDPLESVWEKFSHLELHGYEHVVQCSYDHLVVQSQIPTERREQVLLKTPMVVVTILQPQAVPGVDGGEQESGGEVDGAGPGSAAAPPPHLVPLVALRFRMTETASTSTAPAQVVDYEVVEMACELLGAGGGSPSLGAEGMLQPIRFGGDEEFLEDGHGDVDMVSAAAGPGAFAAHAWIPRLLNGEITALSVVQNIKLQLGLSM